jgi:hypothetical protein
MKYRLLSLAAATGVAGAMIPAHAAAPAAPKPQITDAAGDANGINDQGLGSPVQFSVGTGVDDSAADITSVLFQTQFKTVKTTKKGTTVVRGRKVTKTVVVVKKVPDGFTVTMNLSAAPDANHTYDVWVDSPTCSDGSIDFTYSTGPAGLNEIDCVPSLSSASTDIATVAGSGKAVGTSVVWTLPAAAMPVGTSLSNLTAYTETAAFAEGTLDQADGGTATYKVGG